ncbi:DUF3168 domain-containing protein [Kerstersia gyiorum]|uniref:DUF3168 domain-containing protein n=1 Tax=Kerstersia gyiorum TaxID=206506 RepID=UPI00214FFB63|nr:DUF3168 domain-containing protein [Kerstersia gyiorum]MCR4158822.1 DUF3168 domain-containing protein [Kerstersia gyiorum]
MTTIESSIYALLRGLVANRCYPDITPDNPVFPLIVYQVVGGQALEWLDRTLPDSENYRVQVMCWSKSRKDTNALALAVRKAVIEEGDDFDSAQTIGQAVSLYEEPIKAYGSRQDFSIWIKAR